jgi:hypothetical protein
VSELGRRLLDRQVMISRMERGEPAGEPWSKRAANSNKPGAGKHRTMFDEHFYRTFGMVGFMVAFIAIMWALS